MISRVMKVAIDGAILMTEEIQNITAGKEQSLLIY
jgi:hypothetical protein